MNLNGSEQGVMTMYPPMDNALDNPPGTCRPEPGMDSALDRNPETGFAREGGPPTGRTA